MMKKDGKEIYTFTGLINRMDACSGRSYFFTEKDIPEEVEFRETVYKLSDDKKFYYDQRTGVTLAEVVGEVYGDDIFKFLTAHEFIVTPKEQVKLTSEEREFIRMCNAILKGGVGIKIVYISTDSFNKILGIRFKDDTGVFIPIGFNQFAGIPVETEFTLKDLKIYE